MTVADAPIAVATMPKFAINRAEFQRMLTIAGKVLNTRSPNAIFLCVKISATSNAVEITATDGEIAVRLKTHNVMVESVGEICVPAEKLSEIVTEMQSDTVMISINGETALVESKAGKFTLYTQSAAAFPPFAGAVDSPTCELPISVMRRLLAQTEFAIPAEANAFAKLGTLFEIAPNAITLAATDCRMLAVATVAAESPLSISVIVPHKSTELLESILDDPEDKIAIRAWENGAEFTCGNAVVRTNLLEGNFPPYKEIIPKESDKALVCSADPLVAALKLGMLMTSEETKAVICEMGAMTGLRISAVSAGKGNADIPLACRYSGEDLRIGINPKYLIAGIKAAGAEEVKLEFVSFNRPVKLETPGYTFVVMPTNIS